MEDYFQNSKKRSKTKIGLAKQLLKTGATINTKIVFNEDSNSDKDEIKKEFNLINANEKMKIEDEIDREKERDRIRQKHREKKEKLKIQSDNNVEVFEDFSDSS